MKRTPCEESHLEALYANPLLNRGCLDKEPGENVPWCGVLLEKFPRRGHWNIRELWPDPLHRLCEKAYATEGLLFAGLGLAAALVPLGFLMLKRKGEGFNFKF